MTATATRRTTDHSSDDRAEGGLPTTSAHPRPSSPLAGVSEPARRSQPTPSPPAGGHTNAPSATVPRRLLPRNRARATVTALAKEFGVSFDCVAWRIIAAGTRRDQLPPGEPAAGPRSSTRTSSSAPIGPRRRRWRPQPAVARHPLDGLQCAPPLRDTARQRSAGAGANTGQSDPQGRFDACAARPHCRTVVPPASGRCVDRLHDAVENSPRHRLTASSQTSSRSS